MAKTSLTCLKFLFPASIIFILISFSLQECQALERGQAIKSYYYAVHISSLLPASVCNPSTKGPHRMASLKVVNKHGPCFQHNQGKVQKPTFAQVLISDQSRINSIQARHAFSTSLSHSRVKLPARYNDMEYIITVGLGSPKKNLSLIFDTGSDLTWVKCKPTTKFDPSKSTTFSNITCKSPDCSKLVLATGNDPGCTNSTCTYNVQYVDGSYSYGNLAKDKLTLKSSHLNFLFGCGEYNEGGGASNSDGLLGLGRRPLSILSQTARKYKKFFSYCLPTMDSSDGYLTFGKHRIQRNVKFTPLLNNQNYYYVNIFAISVGQNRLSIDPLVFKKAGSVVDSGTVVTRLPPAAYNALRTAFRQEMKKYHYQLAPPFEILDTCYNFTDVSLVTLPKISFYFEGDVEVDINSKGILVNVDTSQFCLAFAGNMDDSAVTIFGNLQQQTLELVYNVNGGKLGFGHGGCS